MRKLILAGLLAATALPGAANAQYRDELRRDRQEIREDRRELRHDRRERRRDRQAYVAPYRDWRYRPVTIGYTLRPAFWGDRYWVSDYGRYSVPPPRHNQRWIRYGDDLVLVNVRNGRVLRVIRDRY